MTLKILIIEGNSVINNVIYNEHVILNFSKRVEWLFIPYLDFIKDIEHFFQIFIPDIIINISNNIDLDILKTILYMCEKYKIKRLINTSLINTNILEQNNICSKLFNTTVVNLFYKEIYGLYDNYNLQTANIIPRLIYKCYKAELNNVNLFIKESGSRQFLYANDFANIILQFINLPLNSQLHSLIVSPPIESEMSISELVKSIVSEFDFNKLVVYDKTSSDGQISKTCSDIELLKYLPNFEFTPFSKGLYETISFFKHNYRYIRK